jgi:HD-GYP domain-containing protein (c-di-GMP phosphodiesterase class II)
MSMASPGPAALGAVRALVRALSSARQVASLYPAEHPNRRGAVQRVLEAVERLRHASSGDPVLFVVRHGFYLGPTLLARESLSLFRLAEAFEDAGIEAVEFLSGVGAEDVDMLVRALEERRLPNGATGPITINRVRPARAGPETRQERLSDLRRAYATSLEILRETGSRVLDGQMIDLETAMAVVEQLADEVVRDPSQALLLTTIKSYDEYTYHHLINVCMLSIALGHAIGLSREQILLLGLGGLLHDVGKVALPDEILGHVGRLTEEQWRLVQHHPVEGTGLLFATADGLFHPAASIVLEHHAAYDLSGYPSLSGRDLPSAPARLVSVADCFDAVTSRRSYRAAVGRREALAILDAASGTGFDPRLVRVFVRLLGLLPIGSLVELDTGEIGLVVRHPETPPALPTVLIVLDANGNTVDPEERELAETDAAGDYRWRVVRSLNPGELDIDVLELLFTGNLREPAQPEAEPGGLVHEPSHGEPPPEGYVDTHNPHGHHH